MSTKKKKKANTNLMPVYIGAGALLLVGIGVLVFFLTRNRGTEPQMVEKKEPAPVVPKPPDQQPKQEPEPPPKKAPSGGIGRRMELVDVKNLLRQLGQAFVQYELDKNKGPASQKQLSPYYENNSVINQNLEQKWITFIWNANTRNMPDGKSNTVLAYETEPDRLGIRAVLMADGRPTEMDEPTFQRAPKAVPR